MKTETDSEHFPFLKEVYHSIEGLDMEQTFLLSKEMTRHLYCIDLRNKEAYFVQAGSRGHREASMDNLPMYNISEIIQRFAH